MRTKIAIGVLAVIWLGLAPAAIAAPDDLLHRMKQLSVPATLLPKFRVAACRFWQCNCRRECIAYEGSRCVQTYQTCDTCSSCD